MSSTDAEYRAWHRRMTQAAQRAERLSAYGCHQRGLPYDPDAAAVAYAERDRVRRERYPET